MRDLKRIVASNPILSRVFSAGMETYLVGGFVRDAIRGARSSDADFLVRGNLRNLASRIASCCNGKLVDFYKKGMVKVVIGALVLDFTELSGGLEEDLKKRDFTMNAIAWSPDCGLIDPMNGSKDIACAVIRGISRKNFSDDPLRLLRAYRFQGELCWKIDPETRATIRESGTLVRRPAVERITLEFFRLLDSQCCLQALKTAYSDGLLKHIISLDNSKLLARIQELSLVNDFLNKIPEKYNFSFKQKFSQDLSYHGLLRAEVILSEADLEGSRLFPGGAIVRRLRAIRQIRKAIGKKKLDGSAIFDIFAGKGAPLLDLALLSRRNWVVKESLRCLHMRPLLSSREIMHLTGLKGGPELGLLMKRMRKLQFLRKINSQEAARRWLKRNVSKEKVEV